MSQRTALLAVLLILLSVGGPAVGLAAGDVTLTVAVRTAAGGPVGNAELEVTWDGGSETVTTASNGKAFVDVPEGADVTIEVDHRFYVRNEPFEYENVSGGEEVTVTVWEKASASVTVADSEGPLEGVRVTFRKAGDVVDVFTTDDQGRVESGVIERGEYTLSFFEPGYLRKAVTLTIEDETSTEVQIERGSVTLEFQVLDDHFDSPRPVPDATIDIDAVGSVTTQPDGQRAVSVPVNTELRVTVRKPDYETVTRTVVVRESDKQVNLTTRREPAVNVTLANERVVVGETVRVTITDEYGDPLPGATAFVDGSPVGQPDESGVLRVPIDSAGEHTLFASVDQLSSDRVTVTGIQSGAEGTGDGSDSNGNSADGPGEALSLGDLNLRSTAIGIAGGLVLATVLFVFLRSR